MCQPEAVTSKWSLFEMLAARGIDLTARFGHRAADSLEHLCTPQLGALYLPYAFAGPAGPLDLSSSPRVRIRVDELAGIGDHPCNPAQLPVVAIVRLTPLDGVNAWAEMVSLAHLAHRDCQLCAHVWLDRAAEYEVAWRTVQKHSSGSAAQWSLFTLAPAVDDSVRIFLHPADMPPRT